MTTSGMEYVTSKEGILRALIIVIGCITFALVASVGEIFLQDVVGWVLAAFIISWCFSLVSYVLIAANVTSKMECGVSYDAVDTCLTVFSFFDTLLASIVLAVYTTTFLEEWIAAVVFGFILSGLYAVEAYLLMDNAPGNLQFLMTTNGILKSVIFVCGCTSFAYLYASGFRCFLSDCDSARQFAFAAFIYCWAFELILTLIRLSGFHSQIPMFAKLDIGWSAFSCVNYFIASVVLACYLSCGDVTTSRVCSTRLASDIFGFITTLLFGADIVLSILSPAPDDPPSGNQTASKYEPDPTQPKGHDLPVA